MNTPDLSSELVILSNIDKQNGIIWSILVNAWTKHTIDKYMYYLYEKYLRKLFFIWASNSLGVEL